MDTTRDSTAPRRLVEIRSYRLKPGTGPRFHDLLTEESVPLARRWGLDVVTHGPSLHDPDAYYLIRAFRDLRDLQESQAAFYASPEWRLGPRQAIVELIVADADSVLWLPREAVEAMRGG